jgi:hypothetical protein
VSNPCNAIPLQFVDGCGFRPADDIQRHRLMRIAAEAADLKVEISCVEGIAQRRGRMGWPLVPEHAGIPRLARRPTTAMW